MAWAHQTGGVPVVLGLHQKKQDLHPIGPPQMVAQAGQLLGKFLRPRPVPH